MAEALFNELFGELVESFPTLTIACGLVGMYIALREEEICELIESPKAGSRIFGRVLQILLFVSGFYMVLQGIEKW